MPVNTRRIAGIWQDVTGKFARVSGKKQGFRGLGFANGTLQEHTPKVNRHAAGRMAASEERQYWPIDPDADRSGAVFAMAVCATLIRPTLAGHCGSPFRLQWGRRRLKRRGWNVFARFSSASPVKRLHEWAQRPPFSLTPHRGPRLSINAGMMMVQSTDHANGCNLLLYDRDVRQPGKARDRP